MRRQRPPVLNPLKQLGGNRRRQDEQRRKGHCLLVVAPLADSLLVDAHVTLSDHDVAHRVVAVDPVRVHAGVELRRHFAARESERALGFRYGIPVAVRVFSTSRGCRACVISARYGVGWRTTCLAFSTSRRPG